ncbi:MAG: Ig-like domain-containing protein [Candidatus Roizmanbacteria bacterium]|nr:Ig-like domain-containing protein [Candidatus Roizmanbacteria bacterium]
MDTIRKKLIVLVGISFIFVVSVLILVVSTLRKTSIQPVLPTPTVPVQYTTPVPTLSTALRVLSSKPVDGETNVAVTLDAIRILFNAPQKIEQFQVYFGAKNAKTSIGTNVTSEGNQLVIQPLMTLTPKTEFTLTIRSASSDTFVYSLSFTTVDVLAVDTFPTGFDTYTEQKDLKERPDIYLANKLPYATDSFIMTLEVPDNGAYIYHVKSKITDVKKVRNDVVIWLKSIGITPENSAGFDIRYE